MAQFLVESAAVKVNKGIVDTSDCERKDQLEAECAGGLTHREIADVLGIGRARVFYHEQCALEKMRNLLVANGIRSSWQLEETPALGIRHNSHVKTIEEKTRVFSPLHGWLEVNQVMSLNNGSTSPEDVARAYRFLKESHEKLVRPPVLVCGAYGARTEYFVQAADLGKGSLRLRCWPVAGAPRTVAGLLDRSCTAIVESEFDEDENGPFDVPILLCVLVSGRARRSQE